MGQLLPPWFVSKRGDEDDDSAAIIDGMLMLMIVQFGWSLLGLLLAYLFFDAAPPTPPSASTSLKQDNSINSRVVEKKLAEHSTSDDNTFDDDLLTSQEHLTRSLNSPTSASYDQLKREIREMYMSRDYQILFFAISLGLGIFNACLGLLNQIVEDSNYSNDDAGYFGAILVTSGILSSGVAGHIMDATHLYKESLQVCFALATVSLIFFLSMVYTGSYYYYLNNYYFSYAKPSIFFI